MFNYFLFTLIFHVPFPLFYHVLFVVLFPFSFRFTLYFYFFIFSCCFQLGSYVCPPFQPLTFFHLLQFLSCVFTFSCCLSLPSFPHFLIAFAFCLYRFFFYCFTCSYLLFPCSLFRSLPPCCDFFHCSNLFPCLPFRSFPSFPPFHICPPFHCPSVSMFHCVFYFFTLFRRPILFLLFRFFHLSSFVISCFLTFKIVSSFYSYSNFSICLLSSFYLFSIFTFFIFSNSFHVVFSYLSISHVFPVALFPSVCCFSLCFQMCFNFLLMSFQFCVSLVFC